MTGRTGTQSAMPLAVMPVVILGLLFLFCLVLQEMCREIEDRIHPD